MNLSLLVGGDTAQLREQLGGGLPCLRRFERGDLRAELLLFALQPKLPEHMRVDGCIVAVWRVRALGDLPPVVFRAVWEAGAKNEDGGYNCGEHLTALTWYGPRTMVSLGTSDEEALSSAAERGLLPERFGPHFIENDGTCARAVGEWDGLEVELPPLLEGESAQIHMLLAWKEHVGDDREVSPWFAVDAYPWDVACLADQALRPTA